jgi:hypothetical protein
MLKAKGTQMGTNAGNRGAMPCGQVCPAHELGRPTALTELTENRLKTNGELADEGLGSQIARRRKSVIWTS